MEPPSPITNSERLGSVLCPPLLVARVVKGHWKLRKTKRDIEHEAQIGSTEGPEMNKGPRNDNPNKEIKDRKYSILARIEARKQLQGKIIKQSGHRDHNSKGKKGILLVSKLINES